MVLILFGKEPWFFAKEKKKLIDSIEEPELNVMLTGTFEQEEAFFAHTYPLVGNRRGIVVEVENLSSLNNSWFTNYLEDVAEFTDVLVIVKKVDQKTNFFKKILPYCRECKKLSESELKSFIQETVQPYLFETKALYEFLEREDYLSGDIDLIGVLHDLDSLKDAAKSNKISLECVKEVIRDRRVSNIFLLIKLLLNQNWGELSRQCSLISADAALPTIALLLYEFRISYKLNIGTAQEIGAKFYSLRNVNVKSLLAGIRICTTAMEDIKTGKLNANIALLLTCEKLLEELKRQ